MKNKKSLYWQVPLLVFLIVGTFYIARQNRNERLAAEQLQTGSDPESLRTAAETLRADGREGTDADYRG